MTSNFDPHKQWAARRQQDTGCTFKAAEEWVRSGLKPEERAALNIEQAAWEREHPPGF